LLKPSSVWRRKVQLGVPHRSEGRKREPGKAKTKTGLVSMAESYQRETIHQKEGRGNTNSIEARAKSTAMDRNDKIEEKTKDKK